ncbi:MAG: hypothetical protein RLZZ382_1841 [Bacteroidota bacterium]
MRTTTTTNKAYAVLYSTENRSKNMIYIHLSQMNIRWNLLNIRIKQPFV